MPTAAFTPELRSECELQLLSIEQVVLDDCEVRGILVTAVEVVEEVEDEVTDEIAREVVDEMVDENSDVGNVEEEKNTVPVLDEIEELEDIVSSFGDGASKVSSVGSEQSNSPDP